MAATKAAVTAQTNYRGYESAPSPAIPPCKYSETKVKDVTPKGEHNGDVDSRPLKTGGDNKQ